MKFDAAKKYMISLLLGFVLIMCGFKFPFRNNIFHVPIVLNYFQSSEGPHDSYTESLKNFVSYFWTIVGSVANENNISLVFLGFFSCAITAISFIYIFFISDSLWKRHPSLTGLSAGAVILLSPFMQGDSILGHNEIITHYLTHSQFIVPFMLLVIMLILRRNYIASACVLGLSFNINAFVAIWGYIIFSLTLFLNETAQNKVWRLKHLGLTLGIFLALAVPTSAWIFQSQANSAAFEPFNYISFLRKYFPYHNIIDVQPESFLILILLCCYMWSILLVVSNNLSENTLRILKIISTTLIGILMAGSLTPYITNSRLINNLYPLRMDALVYWLIAIFAGVWISDIRLESNTIENSPATGQKIGVWSAILNGNTILALAYFPKQTITSRIVLIFSIATAIILALFFSQTWVPAPPLATSDIWVFIPLIQCIILGISAYNDKQTRYFFTITPLACFVYFPIFDKNISNAWITALMLIMSALAVLYPTKKTQTLTSILIILTALFFMLIKPDTKRQWLPLLGLLSYGIGWVGYYILQHGIDRYYPSRNISVIASIPVTIFISLIILRGIQTIQRGGILDREPVENAFIEAQKWARINIPVDTLFLPINADGFSVMSRRPIWVDWKQGAVVMWSPHLYKMWSERYNALNKLNSMADAMDLARRENIQYIVAKKEGKSINPAWSALSVPAVMNDVATFKKEVIFENDFYQIFKVQKELWKSYD